MDQELEARLSVAGPASAVIQQMNEVERKGFLEMCNQQRVQLLNYIAWDFRHVRFSFYNIIRNNLGIHLVNPTLTHVLLSIP